jgi:hypothetical protein
MWGERLFGEGNKRVGIDNDSQTPPHVYQEVRYFQTLIFEVSLQHRVQIVRFLRRGGKGSCRPPHNSVSRLGCLPCSVTFE